MVVLVVGCRYATVLHEQLSEETCGTLSILFVNGLCAGFSIFRNCPALVY